MPTVLITGGTGLIGTALTKALTAKGYNIIILTRDVSKGKKMTNVAYAFWDLYKSIMDEEAIKKSDFIIHLAGANVAEGRWTAKRKQEIIDSRVKSGELLVKTLTEIPNKVKAVISSSAIGYYGADKNLLDTKPFIETDKVADDFLGRVAQQWEAAIEPVAKFYKRLVILRTGIVLSNEGGAYKEFKKPLNFKVAAILGSGKQMVSWIHIDDIVRMYIHAIENENWHGVYNAVAPTPVSNKALMQTIGKRLSKTYVGFHVPSFILKAMLGQMSIEVLKSTTVSASKVENEGFEFSYPSVEEAIKNLAAVNTDPV